MPLLQELAIGQYFANVDDARVGRTKDHVLLDIIIPNGIPSHDTFGRVFARIGPTQFQQSFLQWTQALQQVRADIIALDGKTHRGSHARPNGKAAIHLVSAWAAEHRLVLGQIAVNDTSNEITAIPLKRSAPFCIRWRSHRAQLR